MKKFKKAAVVFLAVVLGVSFAPKAEAANIYWPATWSAQTGSVCHSGRVSFLTHNYSSSPMLSRVKFWVELGSSPLCSHPYTSQPAAHSYTLNSRYWNPGANQWVHNCSKTSAHSTPFNAITLVECPQLFTGTLVEWQFSVLITQNGYITGSYVSPWALGHNAACYMGNCNPDPGM